MDLPCWEGLIQIDIMLFAMQCIAYAIYINAHLLHVGEADWHPLQAQLYQAALPTARW